MGITITRKCTCGGDGLVAVYNAAGQVISEGTCPHCNGAGYRDEGLILDNTLILQIITQLDAIKAMLDSPLIGMQKTSSNLDDIMVKLDV